MFFLKTTVLMFAFLTFLTLNFDFTIYFYISLLYSVFGKDKLGSSIIDQIGKTAFTAEFLTIANTLQYIFKWFFISQNLIKIKILNFNHVIEIITQAVFNISFFQSLLLFIFIILLLMSICFNLLVSWNGKFCFARYFMKQQ